jgi:hypothetical protein
MVANSQSNLLCITARSRDSALCITARSRNEKCCKKLRAMHHCAESIFKYESIFETAHESVGPEVLFDEKTRGRKSRATVPLKRLREKMN